MAASPGGRFVYVANANSDTVSVIDTRREVGRRDDRLPAGGAAAVRAGSNAVACRPDGGTLYVANGTDNCVAVVRLGSGPPTAAAQARERSARRRADPDRLVSRGRPVSADGKRLFVANVKGHGSLEPSRRDRRARGKNSHDHLGSVSLIDLPDADALAKLHGDASTRNNRLAYCLAGLEKPRPDAKPVPVPERHGEPSVFEHVIYVIKENRTYDQVFGDMKEGNGDPKPVHLRRGGHAEPPQAGPRVRAARQLLLLRRARRPTATRGSTRPTSPTTWRSSSAASPAATPTKAATRSRSPPTGFLWDNALARKKTFRNYGEFVKTHLRARRRDLDRPVRRLHQAGTGKVKMTATPNLPIARAVHAPELPRLPAARRRTCTGRSCSSTS